MTDAYHDGTYMRDARGTLIDCARPGHVPALDLNTIAQALSKICRWGGHCHPFYSVASHSIHVSRLLEATHGRIGGVVGLLHDAHEAYTGDCTTPRKRSIGPAWYAFENAWSDSVRAHFGLPPESDPIWRACHEADRVAKNTEGLALVRGYVPDGPPDPDWLFDARTPDAVALGFLARARRLGVRDVR